MPADDIIFRLDAKTGRAVSQLLQATRASDQMGKSLEGAGRKAKGMQAATRPLTSIVTGLHGAFLSFQGVQGILSSVTNALQKMKQEAQESARGVETVEDSIKNLIQIAGGRQEKFEQFMRESEQLMTKFGLGRKEALDLRFAGYSLGFQFREVERIAEYKGFAKNVTVLAEAIAGIRAAFGETAAGGTLDAQMSALLAAAEGSKVNVQRLAKQVLTPAQSLKRIGATAEETMAAVGVMSKALPSEEEAATALSRLADQMARDPRFKKAGGLTEALQIAAAMPLEQREAFFGMQIRAFKGLGVLVQNLPEVVETIAEVERTVAEAVATGGRAKEAIGISERVGILQALKVKQRAEAARVMAEEKELAPGQLRREAILNFVRQIMVERYGAERPVGAQMALDILEKHAFGGRYMLFPVAPRPFEEFRRTALDVALPKGTIGPGRAPPPAEEVEAVTQRFEALFGPVEKALERNADATEKMADLINEDIRTRGNWTAPSTTESDLAHTE